MEKPKPRFKVVAWYGERGDRFYVVDTEADERYQPAVIRSWTSKVLADAECSYLNNPSVTWELDGAR